MKPRAAPSIVRTMSELCPPLRLLLSDVIVCDMFVRVRIVLDLVFTRSCIFGDVIINQPVCFPASPYMFVAASRTKAWITYHFVPVLEVFTHGLFIPTMSYFMRVQNVWIVQLCMNPNASMPRRLLLCREVSCLVIILSS